MSDLLNFLKDPEARRLMVQDLLDSANRGLVANTIGGPVDAALGVANLGIAGAGYIGHKSGFLSEPLPLIDPQEAFGSSEWIGQQMQQRGMVSGNRNQVAEAGFSMLAPAALGGVKKVGKAIYQGEVNSANAPRTGPISRQRGAIAWHGTPHKFEEFDPSKIGTGEGAQAFGHGLYFAQSKDVASGYRARLSPKTSYIRDSDRNISAIIDDAEKVLPKEKHNRLFSRVPAMSEFLRGNSWDDAASQMEKKAEKSKGAMRALLEDDAKLAREIGKRGVENKLSGRMYKVDIDDSVVEKMIDWENGGEGVWKKALKEAGSAEGASDLLSSRGITGIKYLDSGSRAANSGTTNFVVFPKHAKSVKITDIE